MYDSDPRHDSSIDRKADFMYVGESRSPLTNPEFASVMSGSERLISFGAALFVRPCGFVRRHDQHYGPPKVTAIRRSSTIRRISASALHCMLTPPRILPRECVANFGWRGEPISEVFSSWPIQSALCHGDRSEL